ncbi:MAG: hypothetical protein AAFS07_13325 [Pseudomonadota bacterium]
MDSKVERRSKPGSGPEDTATDSGIAQGVEALLTALADAAKAEVEAAAALTDARHRHREVVAALTRLGLLMDPDARRRVQRHMALIARRHAVGKGEGGRPRTARQEAVIAFLVEEARERFRVWQLAAYLQDLDFRMPSRAAANICRDLTRKGMLTRLGHGHYAIDLSHPTLFDRTMEYAREGLDLSLR